MKKAIIFCIAFGICSCAIAQRLKVKTYDDPDDYREHYTYILDVATISGTPTVFIAGNRTDKPSASVEITGHKLVGMSLTANKEGSTSPGDDNFLLTDFTVQPSVDMRYGAGTGVYYPTGSSNNGYPFLALYNRGTMEIQSFEYFDLSYANYDPSHATGLRIKYSGDEEAYYISGVIADRPFSEINLDDTTTKSKGFILKIPEAGALTYSALVISPENVANTAKICAISDMEIFDGESQIAFTGLNTIDDFTGHH